MAKDKAAVENGQQQYRTAVIKLSQIRESPVALRSVDKESEQYQQLADSVRKRGILTPILVREFEDPEKPGQMLYGLIDGLQRYSAALDAGQTEIPAQIRDMNQAEVEENQIIANAKRIETKPIEFARQIERLFARKPTLTAQELCNTLSCSTTWLYKVMGINRNLHDDLKPLADDSRISMANAYELSKLPKEEQATWSDRAMTQDVGEFTAAVAARVKEIKEAKKAGRKAAPPTFEPVAHARKWAEVKNEFLNHGYRDSMIKRHKVTTPEAGWDLAIAWVANMDPDSQVQQRQDHEAREKKRTEESETRKLERAKQRQDEAAKQRAELEAKIEERTRGAVSAK